MLETFGAKLEGIGYRLELIAECKRLAKAGRFMPNNLMSVMKNPTRYDDFIQFMCFLNNNDNTLLIDVGANIGIFTLDFLKYFPKGSAICFEANNEIIPILKRNTEDFPVTIHNFAISNDSETVDFHIPNENTTLGSIYQYNELANKHYAAGEYKTIEVKTLPLDDFEIPASDNIVLKIDTQGHEVEVLEGAQRTIQRCDAVLLECSFVSVFSDRPQSFIKCAKLLSEYGLVPVVFQRYGKKINSYAFERDVLFVKEKISSRIFHENY